MLFVLWVAAAHAQVQEKMTPVLLAVEDAPVPFMGSDGRVHLVYELWVTNFSSADVDNGEASQVLGAQAMCSLSLDAAAIAVGCRPRGSVSHRVRWRGARRH